MTTSFPDSEASKLASEIKRLDSKAKGIRYEIQDLQKQLGETYFSLTKHRDCEQQLNLVKAFTFLCKPECKGTVMMIGVKKYLREGLSLYDLLIKHHFTIKYTNMDITLVSGGAVEIKQNDMFCMTAASGASATEASSPSKVVNFEPDYWTPYESASFFVHPISGENEPLYCLDYPDEKEDGYLLYHLKSKSVPNKCIEMSGCTALSNYATASEGYCTVLSCFGKDNKATKARFRTDMFCAFVDNDVNLDMPALMQDFQTWYEGGIQ